MRFGTSYAPVAMTTRACVRVTDARLAECVSTTDDTPRRPPRRSRVTRVDGLVERDVQRERIRHAPVVAQRLRPRRLVVGTDERQPADFQQLRGREKHHVRRIAQQRIDERALFDHLAGQMALGSGDSGSEPGRACADDDNVTKQHLAIITRPVVRGSQRTPTIAFWVAAPEDT